MAALKGSVQKKSLATTRFGSGVIGWYGGTPFLLEYNHAQLQDLDPPLLITMCFEKCQITCPSLALHTLLTAIFRKRMKTHDPGRLFDAQVTGW